MKRWIRVLVLVALPAMMAVTAQAQFEPGGINLRPEFGFAIDDNFGILLGGNLSFAVNEHIAVGPSFAFSTAGRGFVLFDVKDLETKKSKSLLFGGRFYYMFSPQHDYPWYLDAGIGIVKYGSVDTYDDGKKMNTVQLSDGQNQFVVEELTGAARFAFNIGGGTEFEINDQMSFVLDGQSYFGSHGKPKLKLRTAGGEQEFEADGGSFWIVTFTGGLSFWL